MVEVSEEGKTHRHRAYKSKKSYNRNMETHAIQEEKGNNEAETTETTGESAVLDVDELIKRAVIQERVTIAIRAEK